MNFQAPIADELVLEPLVTNATSRTVAGKTDRPGSINDVRVLPRSGAIRIE
jgi:hypothetical protein